jgi:predicted TIM-barrel fold metal-dependent hydrolase
MFDVNISYGNWPFRNFSRFTPEVLVGHLLSHGITGGFVASIDTVFQEDIDFYNRELVEKFKFAAPDFIPVATINPTMPNAMDMMEELSPKAVKLIPNYHSYSLLDESVEPVAAECAERRIPLMIQRRMADERTHHPRCMVPGVPLEEIAKFADSHPDVEIICLNLYFNEVEKAVGTANNVKVDISNVETYDTVPSLTRVVGADKILFGSNTPFFHTKSAVMKMEKMK